MMNQDKARSERVKNALRDGDLDAVLCALPSNVLMLTGYFPVVGTSVAIFTGDGEICLLAPEDETELAARSFFRLIYFTVIKCGRTFTAGCSITASLRTNTTGLCRTICMSGV
jgi:Xaa-Pro aminopeptidase